MQLLLGLNQKKSSKKSVISQLFLQFYKDEKHKSGGA